MKKTLSIIAATAAVLAQPALAGNLNEAEPEAIVAPAVQAGPDWTGFYAGGEFGYADVDTSTAGADGDDVLGGFILGYDHDFGQTVLGVGLDYDFTSIDLIPGTTVQNIFRAKARGGYKFGNGLGYVTAGYADIDIQDAGASVNEGGYFVGLGYEHLITDQISVGSEVLYHEFNNIDGSAVDAEVITVQIRAAIRF